MEPLPKSNYHEIVIFAADGKEISRSATLNLALLHNLLSPTSLSGTGHSVNSIPEMAITGPDEQAVHATGTVRLTWYYRGDPASTTSDFYVTEELPERYEIVLGKEATDDLNKEKELHLLPFGLRPGDKVVNGKTLEQRKSEREIQREQETRTQEAKEKEAREKDKGKQRQQQEQQGPQEVHTLG